MMILPKAKAQLDTFLNDMVLNKIEIEPSIKLSFGKVYVGFNDITFYISTLSIKINEKIF